MRVADVGASAVGAGAFALGVALVFAVGVAVVGAGGAPVAAGALEGAVVAPTLAAEDMFAFAFVFAFTGAAIAALAEAPGALAKAAGSPLAPGGSTAAAESRRRSELETIRTIPITAAATLRPRAMPIVRRRRASASG